MAGLKSAQNELGTKHLVLITDDEEREIKEDGLRVRVIPLWKWLLSNDLKEG
jgi:predicted AAA+ superfamily ATPase